MAVALAKDGLVSRFRSLLPKMNKIAGVLLVVAGLYVAYYGYYEVRLFFFDGALDDPIVGRAEEIQTWLVNKMPDTNNYGWYVAGGVAALLMTPASGDELRGSAQSRLDMFLDEIRRASAERRAELEAQLEALKRGEA